MPIDIKKGVFNDSKMMNYKYSSIPLYVNQYEYTISNGGFIKVPFVSNTNEANIIMNDETNQMIQYKTTVLYIVKSQNIINEPYDAELIIEHKSTTNENTLYATFLLKSNKNANKTNMDEVITNSFNNGKNTPSSINVYLQDYVNNNQKTIYYEDKTNMIIIFPQIIEIQSVFESSFKSLVPPLFNTSPTSFEVIENKNDLEIKEGFREGLTQSVYCQPVEMTDTSGGDVTQNAELSIPLVGKYSPKDATNSVLRTAVNFMSFVLVLGITYIISPVIYNNYIVGLIKKTAQDKMNRIRSIDIYICFIFIMCIFGLISQGINENNPNSTIMGFFLGLFFVISFVIIQKEKIVGPWMKNTFNISDESVINEYYTNISVSDDFLKFISENATIVFFTFGGIIQFLFVYGIILLFLALLGSFNKGGIMTSGNGLLYVFLVSVYISIVIHSLHEKQKDLES